MHVRISTKEKSGKTYRYVQFVESYRRQDGMPAQRVLATLGDLPAKTVENLKLALQASRKGTTLIVAPDSPGLTEAARVKANYRYLDLAVMLEMWRSWKLDEVFGKLVDDGDSQVALSDIVAVLVLQRCVAPGSKLYAQQWFPTTALPELLGIALKNFNNSRVHRVLGKLQECSGQLQELLPDMYQNRHGSFVYLFLDTTDTFFEGRGCFMAKRSQTKAGHSNKRTIGIVLLANELGYPLRWKTLPGRTKDHVAMGEMVNSLKDIDWATDVPIVCDRAMGNQSSVRLLLDTGLHFLTAAHVDSIESYTGAIKAEAIAVTQIQGTDASYEDDIESMREAARKLGMEEVDEYLFVQNIGVVAVSIDDPAAHDEDASQEVDKKKPRRAKAKKSASEHDLRLVAYFNPMMFVDQRRRARKHLDELNGFVTELNAELATAMKARQEEPTRRKIVRLLEKRNWVDLFDLTLHPIAVTADGVAEEREGTRQRKPIASFRCELKLREEEWIRRLRYNGFVLLVGHPKLPQTASDLARMYRSKDAVEKDFQTIKSVDELRPIFHYTDPKVCAHVTLCMLALLLQRSLEQRLRSAKLALTSPATVEILRTCHLNLLQCLNGLNLYTVTEATRAQREVLRALQLLRLVDDSAVSTSLTRRVVST